MLWLLALSICGVLFTCSLPWISRKMTVAEKAKSSLVVLVLFGGLVSFFNWVPYSVEQDLNQQTMILPIKAPGLPGGWWHGYHRWPSAPETATRIRWVDQGFYSGGTVLAVRSSKGLHFVVHPIPPPRIRIELPPSPPPADDIDLSDINPPVYKPKPTGFWHSLFHSH